MLEIMVQYGSNVQDTGLRDARSNFDWVCGELEGAVDVDDLETTSIFMDCSCPHLPSIALNQDYSLSPPTPSAGSMVLKPMMTAI
jgi:hypothetical protein